MTKKNQTTDIFADALGMFTSVNPLQKIFLKILFFGVCGFSLSEIFFKSYVMYISVFEIMFVYVVILKGFKTDVFKK